MTFDLAQIITSCFIWFCFGGAVVGILVWATLTQNPEILHWFSYYVPWLFSLINSAFVCPSGYVCTKG